MGLIAPKYISVIGYDDISISSVFIPSLTTTHYPVIKMASEASRILFARIKQPLFKENKEIFIKPELIIRESTSQMTKI